MLEEAETRLNALMQTQFKAIKAEMVGEDLYQYIRAFSAGRLKIRVNFFILFFVRNFLTFYKSSLTGLFTLVNTVIPFYLTKTNPLFALYSR